MSSYSHPFSVGDKVFIRTVTLYFTGKITKIYSDFITLEDAAWIVDTGSYSSFISAGIPKHVEPCLDPVHIALGSIVDITPWRHELLREHRQ
jgi:hypothetical protein